MMDFGRRQDLGLLWRRFPICKARTPANPSMESGRRHIPRTRGRTESRHRLQIRGEFDQPHTHSFSVASSRGACLPKAQKRTRPYQRQEYPCLVEAAKPVRKDPNFFTPRDPCGLISKSPSRAARISSLQEEGFSRTRSYTPVSSETSSTNWATKVRVMGGGPPQKSARRRLTLSLTSIRRQKGILTIALFCAMCEIIDGQLPLRPH